MSHGAGPDEPSAPSFRQWSLCGRIPLHNWLIGHQTPGRLSSWGAKTLQPSPRGPVPARRRDTTYGVEPTGSLYVGKSPVRHAPDDATTQVHYECQRRWKNPHFAGLEFPSFVWLC